jgi:hypothetical protein
MNKYDLQQLLTQELEIETGDDLLRIRFDGVQIPMIQRDYAQGRRNEQEIRNRFLNAIFGALTTATELQLDFVYGSVKEHGNARYFIPLDGQQRLTTLFLLNWYVGQRELADAEALQQQRSGLIRFGYDTRPTARTFCEAICRMRPVDATRPPSEVIRDSSWFYSSYEKDPTVSAMLLMLDDIHELYNVKQTKVYGHLSLLKFYILPLDGFGLTDELYIKMNARGKPLTDFENLKADLIKWMKDETNPEKELFHQTTEYKGRSMPYYMALSLKLDNDWTNFFWRFSQTEKKEEDKIVDHLFLRFFHRFLFNSFIITSKLKQDALDKSDDFNMLYTQDKADTPFRYNSSGLFEPHLGSFGMIGRIEKVLDMITAEYDRIAPLLRPSWDPEDNWRFFDPEIGQTQRILFAAVCGYAERYDFEETSFRQWMRVTWNIINNPDIRSVPAMISSLKLITGLVQHADDVYGFLADRSTVLRLGYNTNTELHEEYLKAKLIVQEQEWEADLISGESHGLFRGSIGFLLSGSPDRSDFLHRLDLANELFGRNGPKNIYAGKHVLMRAAISRITKPFELDSFKMEDSERNWSLLLRRNKAVRTVICSFCSLPTAAEMQQTIVAAVSTASVMTWQDPQTPAGRIRRVHGQLYQSEQFHKWMQSRNVVDLQVRDEHYFIRKYRAWYDLVMLDTYRNELVSELISRFGLRTDSRCEETPFFRGAGIRLDKELDSHILSVEFDQWKTLRIGLKKELNYLVQELTFAGNRTEPGWHYVRSYDYTGPTSNAEVTALADTIGNDIFDMAYPDSLLAEMYMLSADGPRTPEQI